MMKRLACALAVFGAATVFAQDPPTVTTTPTSVFTSDGQLDTTAGSAGRLLYDLLSRDNARNFAVPRGANEYFRQTQLQRQEILALFGDLANGGEPEAAAKDFVRTYGRVLGFPEGGEPLAGYHKFREFAGDAGKFVQFCPQQGGVDFLSGMITFVFDASGRLVAVMGRHRLPTGGVSGGLDAAGAMSKARDAIKHKFPEASAAITGPGEVAEYLADDLDGAGKVVKIFRVNLSVGTPPMPRRVMVSSEGAVLMVEDGRQGATDGDVFPQDPGKSNDSPEERDLPDIVHPGFWSYYTINGKNFKVGSTVPERSSSFWGGFDEKPFEPDPNPKFAEVNVYYHLTKARTAALAAGVTEAELAPYTPMYFDHWADADCMHLYPPDTETDEAAKTAMMADFDACIDHAQNGAWFNQATMTLNFACENYDYPRDPNAAADKMTFKSPAYDSTVVYHEYAHWLQKVLNPHNELGGHFLFIKEAQAVQEGIGDGFAALLTRQPAIAGWYFGDGGRNIEQNILKYTEVVPCWTEKRDDGKGKEIHAAAIALSSVIWKMKGVTGEEKALKVLIAATRLANLPCTFRNMAFALMAADQQVNRGSYGMRIPQLLVDNELFQLAVVLGRGP